MKFFGFSNIELIFFSYESKNLKVTLFSNYFETLNPKVTILLFQIFLEIKSCSKVTE